MHELILDLLSLARIESGQKTFDIGSVSVANVVQTCLASYQGVADSKEIRLEAVGEQENLAVRADEEGLRQILGNLIDNAVKYTPDGGSVTVRWHANDSNVEIEVSDTGIGIAEKNLSRIFERFYRVDKARSRELGGTGLGLSIVKHLVQSFGGTVSAESRSGAGSSFVVTIPRA